MSNRSAKLLSLVPRAPRCPPMALAWCAVPIFAMPSGQGSNNSNSNINTSSDSSPGSSSVDISVTIADKLAVTAVTVSSLNSSQSTAAVGSVTVLPRLTVSCGNDWFETVVERYGLRQGAQKRPVEDDTSEEKRANAHLNAVDANAATDTTSAATDDDVITQK